MNRQGTKCGLHVLQPKVASSATRDHVARYDTKQETYFNLSQHLRIIVALPGIWAREDWGAAVYQKPKLRRAREFILGVKAYRDVIHKVR
jgi:hypothetical protein